MSFATSKIVSSKAFWDTTVRCSSQGGNVASCQIRHVDEVSDCGAIRCGIISAEDIEHRRLTSKDLHDHGHQVGRYATRIFSKEARLVATNWIEVSQCDNCPVWICHSE